MEQERELIIQHGPGVLLARTYNVAGEIGDLWEKLADDLERPDIKPQLRRIREAIEVLRHQITAGIVEQAMSEITEIRL